MRMTKTRRQKRRAKSLRGGHRKHGCPQVERLLVANIIEVKRQRLALPAHRPAEALRIIEVLRETGGNKLETARRLGIGRQTLYNKIKAYQIAA